jgi:hypothetical protein
VSPPTAPSATPATVIPVVQAKPMRAARPRRGRELSAGVTVRSRPAVAWRRPVIPRARGIYSGPAASAARLSARAPPYGVVPGTRRSVGTARTSPSGSRDTASRAGRSAGANRCASSTASPGVPHDSLYGTRGSWGAGFRRRARPRRKTRFSTARGPACSRLRLEIRWRGAESRCACPAGDARVRPVLRLPSSPGKKWCTWRPRSRAPLISAVSHRFPGSRTIARRRHAHVAETLGGTTDRT